MTKKKLLKTKNCFFKYIFFGGLYTLRQWARERVDDQCVFLIANTCNKCVNYVLLFGFFFLSSAFSVQLKGQAIKKKQYTMAEEKKTRVGSS